MPPADFGGLQLATALHFLRMPYYIMGFWRNGDRGGLNVTGEDTSGHERTPRDIFLPSLGLTVFPGSKGLNE